MLSCPVNNDCGKLAAKDGKHSDGIEDGDKQNSRRIIRWKTIDIADVGRCPEKEEPPHAVRKQLCKEDAPSLREGEELNEGDRTLQPPSGEGLGEGAVLLYICQLCLVHPLAFLRFLVEEKPES